MIKTIVSNIKNVFWSPIKTKEDALKVIKDIVYFLYFFGGLYIINAFVNKLALVDGITLILLSFLLNKNKSRFIATLIFIISIIDIAFTILNITGKKLGGGGTNIFLMVLFFLASLRAISATFNYHKIIKTKTIVKNIFILLFIAILYSIIAFALSMIVLVLMPSLENKSSELVGALAILPIVTMFILTYLRMLPFTKNKPIVLLEEGNKEESLNKTLITKGEKRMKKRDKFIIGGIILVALSKLPYLKYQTFDIAGLFGLILMGAFVGLVGYGIFGREKKKENKDAKP